MNSLNITVAHLLATQKISEIPAYKERYLQSLIDELCSPETQITAEEFFCQFRCVVLEAACKKQMEQKQPEKKQAELPLKPVAAKPEIEKPVKPVGRILDIGDEKTLDDTAKHLGIGRTRFFSWLRCEGFLTLDNVPHTDFVNAGLFRFAKNRNRIIVTKKGLTELRKALHG